jgi:hypothetical protein
MRRLLRLTQRAQSLRCPKKLLLPFLALTISLARDFIHLSHLIILCASIFLVVCVLLSERECVDDDNPVSTSSSTITHIFTISFRFLSFLHFPFLPSNPCPPLSPQTSPLYCTFLTRFASPKLPTNLLPFREDFSSDCQYRHALGSLNEHTTDFYSLAGFCSRYGEPIESHGDSVDSLPGNEQESSPAPFDSTIVTSTISLQAVNLPRRYTCLRSVT